MYEDRTYILWGMFDSELLKALDKLREEFGAIKINDYFWKGGYTDSGVRPCDYYGEVRYSDHIFARGFDIKPQHASIQKVYDHIISHTKYNIFNSIEKLQKTRAWIHLGNRPNLEKRVFF